VIKTAGIGEERPMSGSKVTVHYTGKLLDGTIFDSSHNHGSKFTFNLGKGLLGECKGFHGCSFIHYIKHSEVIKAWDWGVASMRKGEICELTCKPQYAYGERGSPPKIPPNATLIFERAKEAWECSDEERMEQAELAKKKGTDFVKEQNYKRAIVQYKKIAELLSHHDAKEDGSDEDRETIGKWNKLKLAGYLNVALCQNKEKLYLDAVHSCEEALKLEATSEKAIYRLAEGLFGLKEYHKAKVQFNKVSILW
uniref:peptidylprolyl isomerase n=1 Tax=Ciona savignyi TaxID=51511 RepID=H2Y9R5_CIOSA